MIVRCAWCSEVLREKEPFADGRETHSICAHCRREIAGVPAGEGEETEPEFEPVSMDGINAAFEAAAEEINSRERGAA